MSGVRILSRTLKGKIKESIYRKIDTLFYYMGEFLEDFVNCVLVAYWKGVRYIESQSVHRCVSLASACEYRLRLWVVVKILLLTGMRGQEIFALEKSDLLLV